MTELETAIRDALHFRADTIDPRETDLRTRRSRRWLPPIIAAAVVVLLAVTAALLVTRHKATDQAPTAGGAGFVGYRWKLVAIDDHYGHLAIPASLHPEVSFGKDRSYTVDDTVNFNSGTFTIEAGGYDPGSMSSTLVGFAGDPAGAVGRILAATRLIINDSGSAGSGRSTHYLVPVRLRGTVMIIEISGTRMTFAQDGVTKPARPYHGTRPPPSRTSTR
jgi:hypothetical protein